MSHDFEDYDIILIDYDYDYNNLIQPNILKIMIVMVVSLLEQKTVMTLRVCVQMIVVKVVL